MTAASHVELTSTFGIEASHQLPHAPEGSVCRRLHGHSWRIEVTVAGPIDPTTGWYVDYHDIEAAWAPLHEALDHRHLNDVDGLANPTSELLAVWIWDRLSPAMPGLAAITVHETCSARCTYRGPVSTPSEAAPTPR